jgi:hypothetical protein
MKSFRRRFLHNTWPMHLTFLLFILHLSHDRSNWPSPSFSSTFQNIPGFSDLLSRVSQFQHRTKLCQFLPICWWNDSSFFSSLPFLRRQPALNAPWAPCATCHFADRQLNYSTFCWCFLSHSLHCGRLLWDSHNVSSWQTAIHFTIQINLSIELWNAVSSLAISTRTFAHLTLLYHTQHAQYLYTI